LKDIINELSKLNALRETRDRTVFLAALIHFLNLLKDKFHQTSLGEEGGADVLRAKLIIEFLELDIDTDGRLCDFNGFNEIVDAFTNVRKDVDKYYASGEEKYITERYVDALSYIQFQKNDAHPKHSSELLKEHKASLPPSKPTPSKPQTLLSFVSFLRDERNRVFIGACVGAALLVTAFVVASIFSAGILTAIAGLVGLAALSTPIMTGICVGAATIVGTVFGGIAGYLSADSSAKPQKAVPVTRNKVSGVNTAGMNSRFVDEPYANRQRHQSQAQRGLPHILPPRMVVGKARPQKRDWFDTSSLPSLSPPLPLGKPRIKKT
jgi:hypothetical protein